MLTCTGTKTQVVQYKHKQRFTHKESENWLKAWGKGDTCTHGKKGINTLLLHRSTSLIVTDSVVRYRQK